MHSQVVCERCAVANEVVVVSRTYYLPALLVEVIRVFSWDLKVPGGLLRRVQPWSHGAVQVQSPTGVAIGISRGFGAHLGRTGARDELEHAQNGGSSVLPLHESCLGDESNGGQALPAWNAVGIEKAACFGGRRKMRRRLVVAAVAIVAVAAAVAVVIVVVVVVVRLPWSLGGAAGAAWGSSCELLPRAS